MYSTDLDATLLEILRKRFVSTCYMGCYITGITRITRRSRVMINSTILDAHGYVSVQFEANVLIYKVGEVIHGAVISQVEANGTIASTKECDIQVKKDRNGFINAVIKEQQVIPIVITHIRYGIGKSRITAVGTPWLPSYTPAVHYVISEGFALDEIAKMNTQLDTMRQLEADLATYPEKLRKWFTQLVYPFKTQPDMAYRDAKEFTLESMMSIAAGSVVAFPQEDPIRNRFYVTTTGTMRGTAYTVFSMYITEYIDYMSLLRGFMITYPNTESIMRDAGYWKLCANVKKS